MSYQVYSAEDFKNLFKAIDSNLARKVEIILIGGSAALLAYKATRLTQDIDSFNDISALQSAYEKAKAQTGLDIPMSHAGVADAPFSFEDRLVPYTELGLKYLLVNIPEIHDFILMKTVRGYAHDVDVIEEISKKNKIDKNVLIQRFDEEMGAVIGNRRTLELNFASVLTRCFDVDVGEGWMAAKK